MSSTQLAKPWGTYLRWMLGTLAAVVLLVGAFNVVMDPLNVFGSPRVAGLNAVKPHLDHHRELTRWRIASKHCASAVILGNSRTEIGLDPEHPAFAALGLSAVNLAVPGTDATNAYRQLLWLQSIGCMPKVVVLGVEFFDFLGAAPAKGLPTVATAPPPQTGAAFFAEVVFSITGLGDSLNTLGLQRARYPATLTDRGFNPLRNYVAEVSQSGHYTLFRQRALENAKNWGRKPRHIRPAGGESSEDAAAVQGILELASAAGSKVHLVIYPYHAQIRLMLLQMGLNDLSSLRSILPLGLRGSGPGTTMHAMRHHVGRHVLLAVGQQGRHVERRAVGGVAMTWMAWPSVGWSTPKAAHSPTSRVAYSTSSTSVGLTR
jgi:hypothetical protein